MQSILFPCNGSKDPSNSPCNVDEGTTLMLVQNGVIVFIVLLEL